MSRRVVALVLTAVLPVLALTAAPSYAAAKPGTARHAAERLVAAGNDDRVAALRRLATHRVVAELRREVRHGMRLSLGDCFRATGDREVVGGAPRGCTVTASADMVLSIYEIGLRPTREGRWRARDIRLVAQS